MMSLDLNAPDIGTAYLPQYQDPTLAASAIPGASALTTDLPRPYRGLGSIVSTWPRFYSQYDSLQMFNADGSVNTARLTPANAGAGTATGAQAMRTVQMQLRFTF